MNLTTRILTFTAIALIAVATGLTLRLRSQDAGVLLPSPDGYTLHFALRNVTDGQNTSIDGWVKDLQVGSRGTAVLSYQVKAPDGMQRQIFYNDEEGTQSIVSDVFKTVETNNHTEQGNSYKRGNPEHHCVAWKGETFVGYDTLLGHRFAHLHRTWATDVFGDVFRMQDAWFWEEADCVKVAERYTELRDHEEVSHHGFDLLSIDNGKVDLEKFKIPADYKDGSLHESYAAFLRSSVPESERSKLPACQRTLIEGKYLDPHAANKAMRKAVPELEGR